MERTRWPIQVPRIDRQVVWFGFEVCLVFVFLDIFFSFPQSISNYAPVQKSREEAIAILMELAFEKFLTDY